MSNSSIKQKSIKGASIRQAGFLTGIHSLPSHIKSRLDELLLSRYSPEKALAQLQNEYPIKTLCLYPGSQK